MRILMLTDFYPPVIGGLERHVQTLAHALAGRGHSVAVVAMSHPDAPAREADGPVRIYRIAGLNRVLAPFYDRRDRPFHPTMPDPSILLALRRIVRQERPDVVNAHSWILFSYLPLARGRGPALVLTMHDYGFICARKSLMRGEELCPGPSYPICLRCAREQYILVEAAGLVSGLALSRRLYGALDGCIAVSGAVARSTQPYIPVPVRVVPTFVPDGVPHEADGVPRPDFLPPEDGYLLFVGALGRHKGVHVLLDAYQRLEAPPPLVLIGTHQPDTPATVPAGVTVAENVAHPRVMAAWRTACFGLAPATWPEPLPQATIEALIAGRPVIATPMGGLPDLIQDGETGLLVPPDDPAALAHAITRLLADPDGCRAMGARAAARGPAFLISAVVPRIEEVFADAICRRARRAGALA